MHSSQIIFTLGLAATVLSGPVGPGTRPGPGDGPVKPSPPGKGCKPKPGLTDGKFDYDALSLREVGGRNTLDWRIWLEHNCQPISFWHDVPLYPDPDKPAIINAVVEIPRWTDGKIEIRRPEPLNPIFHDDRNDAPRFVESVWPHKTYPFVYGSIPQTWENPNVRHPFTNETGDNDPMDFFDIGQDMGYIGQVKQVKILGAIAPNDGGETDWKVLVIDVADPIADLVESWEDVETYRPGVTQALYDWFRYYKVARGDGVIPIIGDKYQSASMIIDEVMPQSHEYWKQLISGEEDAGKINFNQTSFPEYDSYIKAQDTTRVLLLPKESKPEPAAPKPSQYDEWYYVDTEFQLIEQSS